MADHILIAPGHNQTGTVKPFYQLSGTLFEEYVAPESIYSEWATFTARELDGDLNWVEIGLPDMKLTFFDLSRAEYAYLLTLTGNITIYCLNKDLNAYHFYNAKLQKPETRNQKWDRDVGTGFDDVEVLVYEMEFLS